MTILRAQEKVARDCRADHSLFPFARSGLWGKLSDWTEFLVRCSSRAEQSDSRDAHFLSGAENCCVSPLPSHCRTSRFRQRTRRSVSVRHSFLCPANGFRLVRGHRSSHLEDMPALPPHLSVCARKRSVTCSALALRHVFGWSSSHSSPFLWLPLLVLTDVLHGKPHDELPLQGLQNCHLGGEVHSLFFFSPRP